jgi:hypothetical protein
VCCTAAPSALALAPGRHYEMVSPVFKGGFGVQGEFDVAAEGGEAIAFYSNGLFSGAPGGYNGAVDYLARRGDSEWSTVPIMAPAALIAEPLAGDMTTSLARVFEMGHPGANTFNPAKDEQDVLLHWTGAPDTIAGWEAGAALKPFNAEPEAQFRPAYRSASLDLCHLLLAPGETEPLVEEALGASEQLYELDSGCGGETGTPKLVGVNNEGRLIDPACHTAIGDEEYFSGAKSAFNAVSADGQEVFFTVCTSATGQPFGHEVPHQLFVRLAGSRTLEVSRPLQPQCAEVPCQGASERASADFAGASEDGSKAYFMAGLAERQAPLVPNAGDPSNNLYLATIGCAKAELGCAAAERQLISLAQASRDPNGAQPADVMGVVRVAPDGSRAYFVAGGDLLDAEQQQGLEAQGRPVPQVGAANLYVYDSSSGAVAFIGDLCSGVGLSGAQEDARCPGSGSDESLWTDNAGQAQTAGRHGRYLVFATYAQLTDSDANPAQDVYRYDAQTGQLLRVSGGENGFDENGNKVLLGSQGEALGASIAPGHYGGYVREQHEMNNRAISEDGSRIVFTSAEQLSQTASNGLENAYEWHEGPPGEEGSVSLISSGSSEEPVSRVVISPSGQDVFFVTSQGLVPQDTDGLNDVYDARSGPGFPPVVTSAQRCATGACQLPLAKPGPPSPASVTQAPEGNLAPPVAPTAKPKHASARCKKGHPRRKGRCVRSKQGKSHRRHPKPSHRRVK